MNGIKRALGIVVLLAFSACFLRCWNYGVVDLDDYIYLLSHPEVSDWSGWTSVRYFFTSVEEGIWMPLTWASYAIDYLVFGDWYGGFHIHSVVIHAINACLVWQLLRLLFANGQGETWRGGFPCLVGALVWAVHPLRCESVVFLASRKDVLSFFWGLLAMICWVSGSRRAADGRGGSTLCTSLSVVFFVVASMCKPSVMTLPILCLLVDALVIREIRILRYIVPTAYMVFLGIFAAWQQNEGGATVDPFGQPLWGRILGALAAFGIYVRNFVWPQWLAPQCVKTWPDMPRFLAPGIVISAAWAVFLYNRTMRLWNSRHETVRVSAWREVPLKLGISAPQDFLFVGAAWFAVSIAPMLGIANFGYHSFADRFTYIPAVGLSIIIVAAMRRVASRRAQTAAAIAAGACVVALAVCTWHQTGYWENDRKLFSHTIEVDGEHNGTAHGILANWNFEFPHDLDKCVEEFEKAMKRRLTFVMPCYNIYVIALSESGREDRIAESMRRYQKEVERQVGAERARQIWDTDVGLESNEQFFRSMYYSCQLAWLLSGKVDVKSAGDVVGRLKGPALEKDPVWIYLLMKYNRLAGNEEEAERYRKLLFAPRGKKGYIQFSYLRRKDT